jgi:hypothetical protein
MPMEREHHQLVFDGWPEPAGTFFSLASVKNIPTDAELGFQQHVSGRFEGVVTGMQLVKRGGDLVKVWNVAVLEATLD